MSSGRSTLRLGAAAAALCAASLAAAQQLRDPTAPPAALGPQPAVESAASDTAEKPVEAAAAPLALTSIVIGPGRRIATIDGRAVRVGDRIGEARVAAIAPGSVMLDLPAGRRELRIAAPGLRRAPTTALAPAGETRR